MMHIACRKSWRATLDYEAANPIFRTRPDNGNIGDTTVGNPHLGAIQNIRVAVTPRIGAHAAWVAARIWLCQAKTTNGFSTCHTRQPALFLLFGAKSKNREHRQRTLHGNK